MAIEKGSAVSLQLTASDSIPFWSEFRMTVIGAAGSGKTHLALTASRALAGKQWPPKGGAVVDDVLVVETDSAGLAQAREAGVRVTNVLNLSQYDFGQLASAFYEIPALVRQAVQSKPEIRLVCIDVVDTLLEAMLNRRAEELEGPRAYAALAEDGRKFLQRLSAVPRPIVFNFHVKNPQIRVDAPGQKGSAEVVQQAIAVANGMDVGQLDMDAPGRQVAKMFRNADTLVAFLKTRDLPGGTIERTLNFEDKKVAGKRRLRLCVDETEPADLGKLFAKIGAKIGEELK